ncbi:uncharacterized protein LOC121727414 [Aricia agestis]|uniref:uncharacterized protein LOC121727414 n=1 Tax=Aricia agestis TaxID=91739 RepID=UPI001C202A5F|nr:uncharacterized protein LOC121727414 [Aricia agestis]
MDTSGSSYQLTINFIFVLCSLQSFGLRLPQVQKRDVSSTPNVTYEKNINNKVLGVLKKVYSDLKNITDYGQRGAEFPRTYGMSLSGQQGFVWNMLNDARKTFEVGSSRSSRTVEPDFKTERSVAEEQADPAEPGESEGSFYLQIISELLENDEFWDWLTSWIEAYTELLDEHIKVEVEDAVTKQIKEYFDKIDYLINEEEGSRDISEDGISSGQGGGAGLVTSQHNTNSTVYNDYVANIYFTDPKAEKFLIGKLAKSIVAVNATKESASESQK